MKNFHLVTIILFLSAEHFPAISQTQRDTSLTIREAVVSAKRTERSEDVPGAVSLKGAFAGELPSFLGETDIIKTVQMLPGVLAGTDGLSGLYVRGGGADENLLLLDGAPVFTSGHVLGLFSIFPDEAVGELTLYKGPVPERFGGRASSVLDIRTSEGDTSRLHASIGAGLVSGKVHLDGPLLMKGRTTFSASARGMHTILLEPVGKMFKLPANYHFHDLHGKVTHRMQDGGKLEAGIFRCRDDLHYKEGDGRTGALWGNDLGSLKWSRDWEGRLASVLSASVSDYRMAISYEDPQLPASRYGSGMRDMTAKADFVHQREEGNRMDFGAELVLHRFVPEDDTESGKDARTVLKGRETALYAGNRFAFGNRSTANAGARLVLSGSDGKRWISLEPRLSASTSVSEGLSLDASFSGTSQYLHQISPSGIALPFDLWLPVTRDTGPVKVWTGTLGAGYKDRHGLEFSLEGWLKRMDGVTACRDGVLFIDDYRDVGRYVASGKGRSKGLEAMLRKREGRLSGWLAYTLSRTERMFPDGSVHGGEWFPYRYDCRHNLSLAVSYKPGGKWDTGLTWNYTSGGVLDGTFRLPHVSRLDLSASHHRRLRNGERKWSAGVWNAFNRKNPDLAFIQSDGEEGPGSVKTVSILPILPSVSYTRLF